jgi:hypothetical protein
VHVTEQSFPWHCTLVAQLYAPVQATFAVVPPNVTLSPQLLFPLHSTAQGFIPLQLTAPPHDASPPHETVQSVDLPQSTAPVQLCLPSHTTRHASPDGHTTSEGQAPFAEQSNTHWLWFILQAPPAASHRSQGVGAAPPAPPSMPAATGRCWAPGSAVTSTPGG